MKFAGIIAVLIISTITAAPLFAANTVEIQVDAGKNISTVPSLYNVGYNGWGDITSPDAIKHLNGVNVKYCRIIAQLSEMCGDKPGDYRWNYVTAPDSGVGFIDRIRQVIANGWTPIIAFSFHSGAPDLPKWFHGENNDTNGKAWFRYNLDGTIAPNGKGDQYDMMTTVARDTVATLASVGLEGLHWETIYEMGAEMPLDEIHYRVALGIREADPSAKIIGPATWPGWTVEERFVKPYLSKHGTDLLDYVSVHWYSTNEHELWDLGYKPEKDIITMADRKYIEYLMNSTPKYAEWTRTLRTLLDDPKLNPTGKHIGIIYSEFDVNAHSPYQRNPENPDWPKYRADADCYINTNWFGGVWCASTLCNMAASGKADIMMKFNTRSYYGLIENGKDQHYYRMPVWFAWKLLQEKAGLNTGAEMLSANVKSEDKVPSLEAYAVRNKGNLSVILINKSFDACIPKISISGLNDGKWKVTRYLYDQNRTAKFIGRKPGTTIEGQFEGAPEDDSRNELCLKPVGEYTGSATGKSIEISGIPCLPISITVLTFQGVK